MSTEAQPVRREELDLAVRALEAVDAPSAMATLAYEVLSGQAEGRTLFAGAQRAKRKAEEHGLDHDDTETSGGNLLTILERGAKTPLERALVAAFAVKGLGDAIREGDDPRGTVFRFVGHADWLEVSSGYAVYPLVDRVLGEEQALVWSELAQRVVDEAAGRDGDRPEVRARNAARVSALSRSPSAVAQNGLLEIARSSSLDEPTRLLASTLAGDADESPTVPPRVRGRLGRAPRRGVLEGLRWLSGWAALTWMFRALGFLLGLRSEAELRLSDGGLEVRTQVSLFGKTLREGQETWRVDALEGVGRRVRYPSIHLLVGAFSLSAGVLLGSLTFFDGVRSGELVLILLAAALVLAGAGLDLALDVLVPAQKGHVVMDVTTRSGRPLRLTRVPIGEADAFLRALLRASSRAR